MNQLQKQINNHLAELKRKKTTSISPSSSYLVTVILIVILILLSIFVFLIITTFDKNNTLTLSNTILSKRIHELAITNHSYSLNINTLNEENQQLETQVKQFKEKGTDLKDQQSLLSKKISNSIDHLNQLTQTIDSFNKIISVSNDLSNQLTEKLDNLSENEQALIKKIQDLKLTLSEREQQIDDQRFKGLSLSAIAKKSQFDLLTDWIVPSKDRSVQYNLLYRLSRDTIDPNQFHIKCDADSIHNTLVLVLLNDKQIVGGFTMNNWASNKNSVKKDELAFVFNLNDQKKYDIFKEENAILCDKMLLPNFGMGDIEIKDFLLTSSFPNSYGFNASKNELTNGVDRIMISEIEVFTLMFSSLDNYRSLSLKIPNNKN